MPEQSFEELLKNRLSGINEAFQEADADLHRAVAKAAEAVGRVSNGAATLELGQVSENVHGVLYALNLKMADRPSVSLSGFGLRVTGYPITQAGSPDAGLLQGHGKPLATPAELDAFFAEMATNPDSPLVRHLAFIMRKKAS